MAPPPITNFEIVTSPHFEDEKEKEGSSDVKMFNQSDLNVIYISFSSFVMLLLLGMAAVNGLIQLGAKNDPPIYPKNEALLYAEVALITCSMMSSFAVLMFFAVSSEFKNVAVPFAVPLFFTDWLHSASRYAQVTMGISRHHRDNLCLPFTFVTNLLGSASTLWVVMLGITLCISVRSSSTFVKRKEYRFIAHMVVWGVSAFCYLLGARKYLFGGKNKQTFEETPETFGFCTIEETKLYTFLTIPLIGVLINIGTVIFTRNWIRDSYPTAEKLRLHRLTTRFFCGFLLSRVPIIICMIVNLRMKSTGSSLSSEVEHIAFFLFNIGGIVYAAAVVFDFYERKFEAQAAVATLLTIHAKNIQIQKSQPSVAGQFTIYDAIWKGKEVALRKFTPERVDEDGQDVNDVKEEALFQCSLRHPNFQATYGITLFQGSIGVLTERVHGVGLYHLMVDCDSSIAYLDLISWCLQIAKTMLYLHENQPAVVFRSLNPKCCIVQRDNQIKLIDGKMARAVGLNGRRQVMSTASERLSWWHFQNTLYCMAPELAVPGESYSIKADSYSFGMMLWQLWTRNPFPFGNLNLSPQDIVKAIVHDNLRPEMPNSVPTIVRELIMHCWSPYPERRPSFVAIVTILQAELTKKMTFQKIDKRAEAANIV